ncbi:membrane integrity-associated transporter subunit PqiC [Chimaeribacter arupi]|uniref:membrane integrity-associated transporter subunit PqiC n=1 Tax=Chimaeribacter arupi TaxID=2060066 RepID=UPI000C7E1F28|nr:membrane integrity-associated transporter subunit PqiC [Chimaeribacter arupi]PLR39860.1 hypothetical protein CYR23_00510 [Chimaeribacter arupi]
MMKWILPVTLAALLAACSSDDSGKTYYQLPVPTQPAAAASATQAQTTQRQLWIEQVGVADYLNGSGVVYQTNDVQYVIAKDNLWASPLEQQLQQNLVTQLSRDLSGWLVSAQTLAGDQDVLNVTVTGFHGRYDGKAVVSGQWTLTQNGQTVTQPFNLQLDQPEDGYDTLVRTLAQGWQQQADVIAAYVK